MAQNRRLIDADETITKLRDYADRKHCAGHNDLANGILKAVSYIRNEIVRVDAVEVVRCKDCVYYRQTKDWDGNTYMACHMNADVCIFRKDKNDFCSCGERRTDNG